MVETGNMISLLLLAAHMLGDYITQNDWMAKYKLTNWRVRAVHVSVYCLGFVPVLFCTSLPHRQYLLFLAILWITHFIIDSRRWASGKGWPPKPILVDQTIHVITLAIMG